MLKKRFTIVSMIVICLILALACTACSQGDGKDRSNNNGAEVVNPNVDSDSGNLEAGDTTQPESGISNNASDDNQGDSSSDTGLPNGSQENGLEGIGNGLGDNSESNGNTEALDSWVGDYSFTEYAPPDQNMFYSISIFKENNEYYADIYVDGFQTMKRLQAKVIGNESSVNLVFASYLPDNMFDIYQEGDILLGFEKNGSKLLTIWAEIEPMLLDSDGSDHLNSGKGRECFEKAEYPILLMRFNINFGMDDSYDVLQLTDNTVTYSYYDYSDTDNPELKEKTVQFSEMLAKEENGIDKFFISMFTYDGFNVRELELTEELDNKIRKDPEFRKKLGAFIGKHFDRQLENDIINVEDIDS